MLVLAVLKEGPIRGADEP